MATVYSDQMVRVRAGKNIPANLWDGKVRIAVFDFASLAAGSIGDVLVCFKLEKDERLIYGKMFNSALGTSATAAVGTYAVGTDGVSIGAVDLSGRFLAATSVTAAGQQDLGATQALGIGIGGAAGGVLFDSVGNVAAATGTGQDFFVCITNAGAAFATSGRLTGWALLVRD